MARRPPDQNRAGTLFRLAARSLHRDQAAMADYLRRMKAKAGPAAAATAHQVVIISYAMVRNKMEYDSRFGHKATRYATNDSGRGSNNKPPSEAAGDRSLSHL